MRHYWPRASCNQQGATWLTVKYAKPWTCSQRHTFLSFSVKLKCSKESSFWWNSQRAWECFRPHKPLLPCNSPKSVWPFPRQLWDKKRHWSHWKLSQLERSSNSSRFRFCGQRARNPHWDHEEKQAKTEVGKEELTREKVQKSQDFANRCFAGSGTLGQLQICLWFLWQMHRSAPYWQHQGFQNLTAENFHFTIHSHKIWHEPKHWKRKLFTE